MNDEIKEILDNIDIWYKENDLDYSRWFGLEELKQLKDYITNLQEENERLKELCDKYEEEHSNEFKIWKNERHQILDYKSRCERAIEYIKDFENKFKGYAVFPDKRFLDLEELLNILNGSDKE